MHCTFSVSYANTFVLCGHDAQMYGLFLLQLHMEMTQTAIPDLNGKRSSSALASKEREIKISPKRDVGEHFPTYGAIIVIFHVLILHQT